MNLVPGVRWIRDIDGRRLVPRCANAECGSGRGWAGVFHRLSGFRLNGGDWYCSERCLESAVEELLLAHFVEEHRRMPNRTAMPLGLMMLARGAVTEWQLREALRMQRNCGSRIGKCLQRLGLISAEEIAAAVATQWGCPLFPAESVQPGCSMLVPSSLSEQYRMTPVHLVGQGRRLFVAFSERVNHSLLVAMEEMLGCSTTACIISETRLAEVLEYRKQESAGEVAVRRPESVGEVTRTILNYARQTASGEIRLSGVEGNIWVRFVSTRFHFDLVFER